MKKPTLSILTIAVIFAPLTALAQKIQRKHSDVVPNDTSIVDRLDSQINHNAYGSPLKPQESLTIAETEAPAESSADTSSSESVDK
ncbi:MAG: hypothetical protein AAFQ41_11800 [Cyanobacteria bacterium J06623_7]